MAAPEKLFDKLRSYTGHKNKEFSLKSLEVLVTVIDLFVKYMLADGKRYSKLFDLVKKKI